MVSGQSVWYLTGLWLVCGWFVDGLAGLWVVSSFTANERGKHIFISGLFMFVSHIQPTREYQ